MNICKKCNKQCNEPCTKYYEELSTLNNKNTIKQKVKNIGLHK